MSIEQFVAELRQLSPFGVTMTMITKFTKHLNPINVRKLRTYLVCLKLAFPDKRVSDTLDYELMAEIRKAIEPYYRLNPNWNPTMDKWDLFIKIKEPPEMA